MMDLCSYVVLTFILQFFTSLHCQPSPLPGYNNSNSSVAPPASSPTPLASSPTPPASSPTPLASSPVPALSATCPYNTLWNYKNPNHDWPLLPCQQTCSGSMQSPVTIANYVYSSNLTALNLVGYGNSTVTLTNKGYTIEVEFPEGYVGYYKPGYEIAQFHFHTPEENSIFGVPKPVTMHMVHKNLQMTPVSIAVLTIVWDVVSGPDNPFLVPIISALPLINTTYSSTSIYINGLSTLFSQLQSTHQDGYVNFKGSLTTPPCTEGVDWTIFINSLTISPSQYNAFHSIMGFNFRPSQRTLLNAPAYIPSMQHSPTTTAPTPTTTTYPTTPAGPTPAPSVIVIPTTMVQDPVYFNGFWVVLVLLILSSIALGVALVMLRKSRKSEVTRVT